MQKDYFFSEKTYKKNNYKGKTHKIKKIPKHDIVKSKKGHEVCSNKYLHRLMHRSITQAKTANAPHKTHNFFAELINNRSFTYILIFLQKKRKSDDTLHI